MEASLLVASACRSCRWWTLRCTMVRRPRKAVLWGRRAASAQCRLVVTEPRRRLEISRGWAAHIVRICHERGVLHMRLRPLPPCKPQASTLRACERARASPWHLARPAVRDCRWSATALPSCPWHGQGPLLAGEWRCTLDELRGALLPSGMVKAGAGDGGRSSRRLPDPLRAAVNIAALHIEGSAANALRRHFFGRPPPQAGPLWPMCGRVATAGGAGPTQERAAVARRFEGRRLVTRPPWGGLRRHRRRRAEQDSSRDGSRSLLLAWRGRRRRRCWRFGGCRVGGPPAWLLAAGAFVPPVMPTPRARPRCAWMPQRHRSGPCQCRRRHGGETERLGARAPSFFSASPAAATPLHRLRGCDGHGAAPWERPPQSTWPSRRHEVALGVGVSGRQGRHCVSGLQTPR